jgi:cytochrome c
MSTPTRCHELADHAPALPNEINQIRNNNIGQFIGRDSRQIKAMFAYIRFIGWGLPIGHCTERHRTPPLPPPMPARDSPDGPAIVTATCALVLEAEPPASWA